MHPVVEQLGGLGAVGCPEDGPQVLLELPGPDRPRAGPLLERLEPRPLAVGEVLGVLHERVAAALDGGRLLLERPDLLGRQLAFGRPAALALGPGPGGPGGGPGGVPLLAAHGVERVVHPLDHVEGVHDPPRVGAAALDQLPYPPRAVGGHHLYGAPLLARELVEEQVEHVLAGALVRPDEAAAVVVDDHRDVLVALLVRRLVDADAAHAVEPRGAARGLQLGVDAPAHAAHAVPLDAGELGDRRGGAADRQPRHPVLEVAREARPVPRPGDGLGAHAVLRAAHPAGRVLQVAGRARQVHRPPQPGGPAVRHVVEVAGPAAYGAAALLALVGPDAHDDALGLDARAQDDRAGQTEGEK